MDWLTQLLQYLTSQYQQPVAPQNPAQGQAFAPTPQSEQAYAQSPAGQNRQQTESQSGFQNYWFGRGPIGSGGGGQAWTPEASQLMAQNWNNFLNPGGGRMGNENFGYGIPGQYGWAGFTRGTNPDPYQNPFVGDVSWLRGNNPSGPFDYFNPGFSQGLGSAMSFQPSAINPMVPGTNLTQNELPYGFNQFDPNGNATLLTNPVGSILGEHGGSAFHGGSGDMMDFLNRGWNPFGGGGEAEKDINFYV